jgi:hypothetical protein
VSQLAVTALSALDMASVERAVDGIALARSPEKHGRA